MRVEYEIPVDINEQLTKLYSGKADYGQTIPFFINFYKRNNVIDYYSGV